MSTIIIADLHNSVEVANEILELEPNYQKAVFLGDYWDQFHDTAADAKKVADWLKESLSNEKHIHLVGNHDWMYTWPSNRNAWCSGYSPEKMSIIQKVLDKSELHKLKLYHREGDLLLTHAGVSRRFLNYLVEAREIKKQKWTVDNVCKILDKVNPKALKAYVDGKKHILYAAGYSRGGDSKVGGPIWADFSEFFPTEFPQIFGHTPVPKGATFKYVKKETFTETYSYATDVPDSIFEDSDWGLNIDSHRNSYVKLDQGFLYIYKLIFDKDWSHKNRQIIDRQLQFSKKIF